MSDTIIVALIGALATVVAAFIGARKSADNKKKVAETTGTPPRLRSEIALVAVALLVAGVLVAYAIYKTTAVPESVLTAHTQSFRELVKDGLVRKPPKEYVIPSVAMIIRPERVGNPPHIESDIRIVYNVHGLSPAEYPKRAFNDFAHSSTSTAVQYVPGADKEELREGGQGQGHAQWDVFYARKPGERHTVVTGYRYLYPPQLGANRTIEGLFTGVGPNEDAFCYPNTDDDVIEELVMLVESDSLAIRLPEGGIAAGIRRSATGINEPVPATQASTPGLRRRVISARFRNLQPHDVAGIRVAWDPVGPAQP